MKKIKYLVSAALVGFSLTSCNDFLTLTPLNDIVLENFWTNRADVESVLLGAYASLEQNDCMLRMSIWGEMRSDNITTGKNPSEDIQQILRDNILSTNSYSQYKCFYEAINYANTVLHFAPEVSAKDPNYNYRELKADEAEAVAIRSLAYWYLLRAYKDIPFTTEPSIDDTKEYFLGQTPFDQVLDSLINDLERVKDDARRHHEKDIENTSRFTSVSIYAMLADMYLWQGNWDKCVECCEEVTRQKLLDFEELLEKEDKLCTVQLTGTDLEHSYPLYKEDYQTDKGLMVGNAYNKIFGEGNSFEILFELPYDNDKKNPLVSSYYSPKELNGGQLKATNEAAKKAFVQHYDIRLYQNIYNKQADDNYIVKYAFQNMSYDMSTGTIDITNSNQFSYTTRESTSPNWIIYRYTDILLMEAEAKVMKAKELGAADSINPASRQLFEEAFYLVDAVNRRALGGYPGAATEYLKIADYISNFSKMEELVLDERRRELMFEGKRWFDLVRKSLRDGNTNYLWNKIENKFDSNSKSAVRIKLTNLDALFFPFDKDEVKINDLLKQNPTYIEDEFIQKAQ